METQNHGMPIEASPEFLEQLHKFIHAPPELDKAGYILSQLNSHQIKRKQRCFSCKKKLRPAGGVVARRNQQNQNAVSASLDQPQKTTQADKPLGSVKLGSDGPSSPLPPCRFHPGIVQNRVWTCCMQPPFAKPCTGKPEHMPRRYAFMELENYWMFYQTCGEQLPTHAKAVSIDCEMGTSNTGESELIRVSVVDYFTGGVLLDSLVYPDTRMAHYNTKFSGVSRRAMEEARRQQRCLLGKGAARSAILQFVGPETIVIGHGLHMDLTSLRWVHTRIVDTFLLEQGRRRRLSSKEDEAATDAGQTVLPGPEDNDEFEAADNKQEEGGLSLKTLAKQRLQRAIQQGHGHDSIEDAIATRDLLHWHVLDALVSAHEKAQSEP